MTLVLALVALVFALVDEIRFRGQSLTTWAVIALALIYIVGRF